MVVRQVRCAHDGCPRPAFVCFECDYAPVACSPECEAQRKAAKRRESQRKYPCWLPVPSARHLHDMRGTRRCVARHRPRHKGVLAQSLGPASAIENDASFDARIHEVAGTGGRTGVEVSRFPSIGKVGVFERDQVSFFDEGSATVLPRFTPREDRRVACPQSTANAAGRDRFPRPARAGSRRSAALPIR